MVTDGGSKIERGGGKIESLKIAIVGASGYIGNELAGLLYAHPGIEVLSLYVSEQSKDAGKLLSEACPKQQIPLTLQALTARQLNAIGKTHDAVFLATPHQVSHDIAPVLLTQGARVFDLSGGFRLGTPEHYTTYYSFKHKYSHWLQEKAYGLPEWTVHAMQKSQLIAVGGCYASAAQLALLPLTSNHLLDISCAPVVHGMSGVSGAGKVVSAATQYCEVSLKPYGVFSHRHQPEIEQQLHTRIVFTPHLCPFKRGLMVTCSARLAAGVSVSDVSQVFHQSYQHKPFVVLSHNWPTVNDVAYTPYCHIHWQVQASSNQVIVVAALDNLLKGAASQAIQCFNLTYGLDETLGLLPAITRMQAPLSLTMAKEEA